MDAKPDRSDKGQSHNKPFNRKLERFVLELYAGKTPLEAMEIAGYKPSAPNARRMANSPEVRARLSQFFAQERNLVEIEVMRNVKTPRVALVVHAIRGTKAKSVTVKTPNRDRVMTPLELGLPASATECSAVGFIGKDRAINAWPVSGGTAARFTKGFAGPDLTLGSAGVRKVSNACKAPTFFVSADEAVSRAVDRLLLRRKHARTRPDGTAAT